MEEVLQSILALIVTLSILVTIHEFGHYWVARLCGVHVLRFSVGFGQVILSRRGRAPVQTQPPAGQPITTRNNQPLEGTEFAIAAIPLGGYVKMLDEREGFVPDDLKHMAFNNKSVLQRIAIVAAGPIANFLLAIVAYWVLFMAGVTGIVPKIGEVDPESAAGLNGFQQGMEIIAVDGEPTGTWSEVNMQLFGRIGDTGEIEFTLLPSGSSNATLSKQVRIVDWLSDVESPFPTSALGLIPDYPMIPALIGSVVEGEAAALSGIQAGDKVTRFNDIEVTDWHQLVRLIQAHGDQQVELKVLRSNQSVDLKVTPKGIRQDDGSVRGFLGAARVAIELPEDMQRTVTYPFYSAWIPAVEKTWSVTVFTLDSIRKMIVGAISPKNLSGPITIAQIASATAESGLESFIGFIALLSISLGVLNLLPIPVLDGGHLLYCLVELVTRKPVPERVQVWGMQMGMFVIVSIMLLALYNDLSRL
ncbi:MAG: regulator of sigma E protease [Planctomycetaceae bacterium]|jgi:regulator of sigma E protease